FIADVGSGAVVGGINKKDRTRRAIDGRQRDGLNVGAAVERLRRAEIDVVVPVAVLAAVRIAGTSLAGALRIAAGNGREGSRIAGAREDAVVFGVGLEHEDPVVTFCRRVVAVLHKLLGFRNQVAAAVQILLADNVGGAGAVAVVAVEAVRIVGLI